MTRSHRHTKVADEWCKVHQRQPYMGKQYQRFPYIQAICLYLVLLKWPHNTQKIIGVQKPKVASTYNGDHSVMGAQTSTSTSPNSHWEHVVSTICVLVSGNAFLHLRCWEMPHQSNAEDDPCPTVHPAIKFFFTLGLWFAGYLRYPVCQHTIKLLRACGFGITLCRFLLSGPDAATQHDNMFWTHILCSSAHQFCRIIFTTVAENTTTQHQLIIAVGWTLWGWCCTRTRQTSCDNNVLQD